MNLDLREPANLHELDSLLRLRYAAYASDPLLQKMVSDREGYDLTHFDQRAMHFGGFINDKPVAYLRMTTNRFTRFAEWVNEIAAQNNIALLPNGARFPFETFSPDKTWNSNFLAALENKKIGEVGKLAIHREHRKRGLVLEKLISAFVDHCHRDGFDTGFGSCTLPLERYYRKFGFSRAEGATPFVHQGLPPAVIVRFDREEKSHPGDASPPRNGS